MRTTDNRHKIGTAVSHGIAFGYVIRLNLIACNSRKESRDVTIDGARNLRLSKCRKNMIRLSDRTFTRGTSRCDMKHGHAPVSGDLFYVAGRPFPLKVATVEGILPRGIDGKPRFLVRAEDDSHWHLVDGYVDDHETRWSGTMAPSDPDAPA